VSIDGCRKTGVVFEHVIASCELVNCSGMQVQCLGTVPTVSVDKCDGVQVFINSEVAAKDFQVRGPGGPRASPGPRPELEAGSSQRKRRRRGPNPDAPQNLSPPKPKPPPTPKHPKPPPPPHTPPQLVTAKSSEVNLTVVPADPDSDADAVEHAVPEQFISSFQGGKLVTVAASHGGG
jgi:hypothetical protein